MSGGIVIQNAVEIKNVRKVFTIGDQKIVALNDISLEIKKGEVCCLFGTSGSGKSTLLNMMAGLEKPTRGIIKLNGVHIEKMSEKNLAKFRQKNVGFIFQAYNLLNALTAIENVSLPLTFRGMRKKEREQVSKQMLEAVGLHKYLDHTPNQMSGGQQQRVGIARAFVTTAPIIFADEPTGNLDSKTTHEVMELMLDIARKHNETLIIVTHDRSIAKYADKIVHILDGNIKSVEERTKEEEA